MFIWQKGMTTAKSRCFPASYNTACTGTLVEEILPFPPRPQLSSTNSDQKPRAPSACLLSHREMECSKPLTVTTSSKTRQSYYPDHGPCQGGMKSVRADTVSYHCTPCNAFNTVIAYDATSCLIKHSQNDQLIPLRHQHAT